MMEFQFLGLTGQQIAGVAGLGSLIAILLYFLRPRPRAVAVSSHFLWEQALGKRRDPRWRERIALLLQCLILLGMALALGDPQPLAPAQAAPALSGKVVRPSDRVAVVDLSASMRAKDEDGVSRLERVKKALLAQADGLEERERMAVVSAGRHPRVEVPLTGDRDLLSLAIRGLQPSLGRVDLGAALALASSLPGLGARPSEIRAHVDDEILPPSPLPKGARLVVAPPDLPRDNLAISAFGVRASQGLPAQQETLVRVRSFAGTSARALLSIETESQVLGRVPLTVAPGQEVEKTFRFFPRSEETLEASLSEITMENGGFDALSEDDRAHAFLEPLKPARALMVTRGNRYLERALALIPGLSVKTMAPGAEAEGVLGGDGFDLSFLDGWAPRRIPSFPAVYINPPAGEASPFGVVRRVAAPVTTDWNLDHPLLRGLVLRDLNIAVASILTVGPSDRRLIGTASGPIGLVREGKEGRWMALGFDFADSDLPLRVAFPQLIYNMIQWAREGRAVGEARGVSWRARDALTLGGPAAGAGRLLPWEKREEGTAPRWTWPHPSGDGLTQVDPPRLGYVRTENALAGPALAISMLDPEESNLGRVPPPPASDPARRESPPAPAPREEPPLAPWILLAAFALALLLLEYGVGAR